MNWPILPLMLALLFSGIALRTPEAQLVPDQVAAQSAPPACDATPGQVPKTFRVKMETTAGDFIIEAHHDWAPQGTERFYQLVCAGYFDDSRFFRVVPKFIAQFGVAGNPRVNEFWSTRPIPDDPVKQSNLRGYVAFAMAGPGSRTTQLFVNLDDNARLDRQGFAPIGKVVEGMDAVDKIYSGYGENSSGGIRGGKQQRLYGEGNRFLDREFPKLDKLTRATLLAVEQGKPQGK